MPLFHPFTLSRAPTPTPPQSYCPSTSVTSAVGDDDDVSWETRDTPDTSVATLDYAANPSSWKSSTLAEDDNFFGTDTDTFPMHSHLFPQEANGTWRNETSHLIRHPCMIDWPAVGSTLQDAATSAAEQASEALNRACEGHDVVEIGNRIVDLIPKISMPTIRQFDRTVDQTLDRAADAMQNFAHQCSRPFTLRRHRCAPQSHVEAVADNCKNFKYEIGYSAQDSLTSQGILKPSQMASISIPASCQGRLSSALSSLFGTQMPFYGKDALFGMTPVWMADGEKKVWTLALDTALVEVETDSEEKAVLLEVGFELDGLETTIENMDEWVDMQ